MKILLVHSAVMADSIKYDLVAKKPENEKRNKVIKIVVAVVIVVVVFIVGFLIGYFSRRPSKHSCHSDRSIGPEKAEQHEMFQEGVNAEILEENVR